MSDPASAMRCATSLSRRGAIGALTSEGADFAGIDVKNEPSRVLTGRGRPGGQVSMLSNMPGS